MEATQGKKGCRGQKKIPARVRPFRPLQLTGVKITLVRQPELSTTGSHGKLLLAIYSYFAEAAREFISMRGKQGLAAAWSKDVKLGRLKGSRNKKRVLDP